MDENDVIVIDTRNAVRTPISALFGGRPPVVPPRPPVIITQAQPQQVYAQPQPVYMHQPAQSGTVYVRDPATGALVREPAGGVAPTVGTASRREGASTPPSPATFRAGVGRGGRGSLSSTVAATTVARRTTIRVRPTTAASARSRSC